MKYISTAKSKEWDDLFYSLYFIEVSSCGSFTKYEVRSTYLTEKGIEGDAGMINRLVVEVSLIGGCLSVTFNGREFWVHDALEVLLLIKEWRERGDLE